MAEPLVSTKDCSKNNVIDDHVLKGERKAKNVLHKKGVEGPIICLDKKSEDAGTLLF